MIVATAARKKVFILRSLAEQGVSKDGRRFCLANSLSTLLAPLAFNGLDKYYLRGVAWIEAGATEGCMRSFLLFLLIAAALGWAAWSLFFARPEGPPYVGGVDPEGGNIIPYIGDTNVCAEKSGRTVNRTVEDVDGFADLVNDRGCGDSCRYRLRNEGYRFVEYQLSEKQAEHLRSEVRLHGRSDLEYSAIATEAGWYRFERTERSVLGTTNYERFRARACESYLLRPGAGKCEEDNTLIAMTPIPAPSARYQLRAFTEEEFVIKRRWRLKDYSVRVTVEALEIRDTQTDEAIATDRQVMMSYVNPRPPQTSYLACGHRNGLAHDVAKILIP